MISALCLALVTSNQVATVEHTFTYVADPKVKKVTVAGTFNQWNKGADVMVRSSDGKTWTKRIRLRPGAYHYKFILNDETWITDPRATRNEDDGNGNTNSVLLLLPTDFKSPAVPGDSRITKSVLAHVSEVPDLNWDRGKLTLSLTARPGDVRSISAIAGASRYPMRVVSADDIAARYRAWIPWDGKSKLRYRFELDDGKLFAFGPKGLTDSGGDDNSFSVSPSNYRPFVVPEWVERTVFYQIFPDRFMNGNPANDPKQVEPWDAKPLYWNRFGGDFAGVAQKVGHLKSLGIGAIYFNPVFLSPSNHRYEAIDYYRIDPELGSNEEFVSLTKVLKREGIGTVLDGVFNHTAPDFFAFKDVMKNGAASKYRTWYRFHSFPVRVGENPNYDAWWGYPSMPKLNVLDPEAKKYMLQIPLHWQGQAEIAGWRLDVANEVPMEYWRAFRRTVKEADPNVWVVGEHWGDSSPWLKGDQWDATMNYQFREAVLQLVGKGRSGKPSAFMDRLMHTYNLYAPQVNRNQMNLLGSHDTARILTECGGDEDLAKLAAVVLFTWVGAPCVYYGDELGMEGGADPDNRRGMRWDLATDSNSFLKLYRQLARLRRTSVLLQSGDPRPLFANDEQGTVAYARELEGASAFVAINRSSEPRDVEIRVGSSTQHSDALSGNALKASADGVIHLKLAPKRAAILMPLQGTSPRRLKGQSAMKGPRPLAKVHRSTNHHASNR